MNNEFRHRPNENVCLKVTKINYSMFCKKGQFYLLECWLTFLQIKLHLVSEACKKTLIWFISWENVYWILNYQLYLFVAKRISFILCYYATKWVTLKIFSNTYKNFKTMDKNQKSFSTLGNKNHIYLWKDTYIVM